MYYHVQGHFDRGKKYTRGYNTCETLCDRNTIVGRHAPVDKKRNCGGRACPPRHVEMKKNVIVFYFCYTETLSATRDYAEVNVVLSSMSDALVLRLLSLSSSLLFNIKYWYRCPARAVGSRPSREVSACATV